MARPTDAELRATAERLLNERKAVSEPPGEPDVETPPAAPKKKPSAALVATGGVSGAALLAVVVQLLQARVTPEQLNAMRERIDALERQGVERRNAEFERDVIENCHLDQQQSYLQQLLPRADRQGSPPPGAWFNRCQPMPDPTKGVKLPQK